MIVSIVLIFLLPSFMNTVTVQNQYCSLRLIMLFCFVIVHWFVWHPFWAYNGLYKQRNMRGNHKYSPADMTDGESAVSRGRSLQKWIDFHCEVLSPENSRPILIQIRCFINQQYCWRTCWAGCWGKSSEKPRPKKVLLVSKMLTDQKSKWFTGPSHSDGGKW